MNWGQHENGDADRVKSDKFVSGKVETDKVGSGKLEEQENYLEV